MIHNVLYGTRGEECKTLSRKPWLAQTEAVRAKIKSQSIEEKGEP